MNRLARRRSYFANRHFYALAPTWQEHNAKARTQRPIVNMTKRIATRKPLQYDNQADFTTI